MSEETQSWDSNKHKSSSSVVTLKNAAFERLPKEIIEQIILLTSPNAFSSLIFLNRKWRIISQQAHLYAHHLSRCPSYSAAHPSCSATLTDNEHDLPRLRRLFAREIKRNLFEVYLRPHETIISLVSTSIGSSSAPGGEAFHFSLSPKGHYVLAYSSSRIHVIDVTGREVLVKRELKILRRPASTTITDDGTLLAVLSTDLQVDLYDLTGDHPKHTHAVALDHTPRTIALSPAGTVLAAAYDSGVEVSSLDPGSTSTERRQVKCYAVDTLSFSKDGTQLLGTSMQSRNPSTVILTAPYYNTGGTMPEETVSISALWTTSILFPNGSRDCSHAVLLPSPSDDEASWAFTYDRVLETFRAVRIDDLRNGTTYFTGPLPDASCISKLLPSTLPTASQRGDLVASGFQDSIWLYGVPEDLDALPVVSNTVNSNTDSGVNTPLTQLGRRNSAPSLRSVHRYRESFARAPQWQLLCDRFRNTFVEGRKITTLDQVSKMSWVSDNDTSAYGERLVAVAPGVGAKRAIGECWEDDGMSPVDGGRISILDFDYAVIDGMKSTITIEVGNVEPEVLEEEHRDLDTEVALVRRRTVAQRRGNRSHVSRSSVVSNIPRPETQPASTVEDDLCDRYSTPPAILGTASNQLEYPSMEEVQDALDAPYSHTSPRSGTTLRRAATAAAVNRRLHPRAVAQDHIEYRRADGREEHPHESDADNWVPPPPPYSKDPVPPLPEHIQRSILAEAAQSAQQRNQAPSIDFPGLDSNTLNRFRTGASTVSSRSRRESYPIQRRASDHTSISPDRVSIDEDRPRPSSSPGFQEFDDLYDISPPGSPSLAPRTVPAPVHQIARRPVESPASGSNPLPSPAPSMRATLLGPVSPLPLVSPSLSIPSVSGERRYSRDVASESQYRQSTNMESTALRLDDNPPRLVEEHHLTQVPSSVPVTRARQQVIESRHSPPPSPTQPRLTRELSEENTEPWRLMSKRSRTAPAIRSLINEEEEMTTPIVTKRSVTAPAPTVRSANAPNPGSMELPSADQLARLSSRHSRPQGMTDPTRRMSGGGNPPRRSGSGHIPTQSWERSQQYGQQGRYLQQQQQKPLPHIRTESSQHSNAPRAAVGAYGSPGRNSFHGIPSQYTQPGPPPSHTNSPSRRISLQNANNRSRNPSSPFRPPMERLETIHSVTSQGEPSPYFLSRPMAVGLASNSSRAERSAAKNIRDAKKRGWRASMNWKKESKEKFGDTASSAGWTDVSYGNTMEDRNDGKIRKEKEGREKKCVIM